LGATFFQVFRPDLFFQAAVFLPSGLLLYTSRSLVSFGSRLPFSKLPFALSPVMVLCGVFVLDLLQKMLGNASFDGAFPQTLMPVGIERVSLVFCQLLDSRLFPPHSFLFFVPLVSGTKSNLSPFLTAVRLVSASTLCCSPIPASHEVFFITKIQYMTCRPDLLAVPSSLPCPP